MKSISEISQALSERKALLGLTHAQLCDQAGISNRTMQLVLSGQRDYKLSTLLAVADKLGFELLLVPKEASRGLSADSQIPVVTSRVQAALARVIKE